MNAANSLINNINLSINNIILGNKNTIKIYSKTIFQIMLKISKTTHVKSPSLLRPNGCSISVTMAINGFTMQNWSVALKVKQIFQNHQYM